MAITCSAYGALQGVCINLFVYGRAHQLLLMHWEKVTVLCKTADVILLLLKALCHRTMTAA